LWLLLAACADDPAAPAAPTCVGDGETDLGDDGSVEWGLQRVVAPGWTRDARWSVTGPPQRTDDLQVLDDGGDLVFQQRSYVDEAVRGEVTETWQRGADGRILVDVLDDPITGLVVSTWSYDGDLVVRVDQDLGGDGVVDGSDTFAYDPDGRLVEQTVSNGWAKVVRTYLAPYPGLDFHLEEDIGQDGTVDFTSDAWFDAEGRLIHVVSDAEDHVYVYDRRGDLVGEHRVWAGAEWQDVTTTYDDHHHPLEALDATAHSVTRTTWAWSCG
jgi:YD repeat-containing protein